MKEFNITFRYKNPNHEIVYADTEQEVLQKLKDKLNCYGDTLEILEIKEIKTYEVEFEYRSYQSTRVGAHSEEELREFFKDVASHDPDEYTKEPDVIITKITEVKDEEEE